jgi:hypothetical protein
MAKKKEDPKPLEEEKEELVPVLMLNGCISHYVVKKKD